jgi:hypothetical protein
MATFNTPTIQILLDAGKKTVVKVIGAFNAAVNAVSTTIIQANTLMFANNNQPCVISVLDVQYLAGFANGFGQLYWVGPSSNTEFLNFGGRASGDIDGYMWNTVANTGPAPTGVNFTNLKANSGDIGLTIWGAEPFDSYSLVITCQKELGYANAELQYNDTSFHP